MNKSVASAMKFEEIPYSGSKVRDFRRTNISKSLQRDGFKKMLLSEANDWQLLKRFTQKHEVALTYLLAIVGGFVIGLMVWGEKYYVWATYEPYNESFRRSSIFGHRSVNRRSARPPRNRKVYVMNDDEYPLDYTTHDDWIDVWVGRLISGCGMGEKCQSLLTWSIAT